MGRKRARDFAEKSDFFQDDNIVSLPTWQPPKTFKALTPNHHRLIYTIRNNSITIINGPAGSLKTFLTLQCAIEAMQDGYLEKLIYIRQNIQRPNEKGIGFLPGDKNDKMTPLIRPIRDNLESLLSPYELSYYLEKGKIEGSDVETIRGRSPQWSFLFCDEAQNCDLQALESIMTRRTESSKLVLAGDFKSQRDVKTKDFDAFELVCQEFDGVFPVVNLTKKDILRSETCIEVLNGFERIKAKLEQ